LFNLFQTYSLLTIVKGRYEMGVAEAGENYKCNICGNEVTVTKAGGGVLVCCGEDMEKTS
jgi:desulfoferrodoxin-like iron-binding protein